MAAITPSSAGNVQGIFKIFKFTDVDDGENFAAVNEAPVAYWAQNCTDPSTNTSAGVNVVWDSTNGFVFYPGVDNSNVTLFVIYGQI